jgi:hypothetical protein
MRAGLRELTPPERDQYLLCFLNRDGINVLPLTGFDEFFHGILG